MCLQLDHSGCMASLALLRQLFSTHAFTNQLLDSEHEVGSGIFDPTLTDPEHCNASNTTSWDLCLLARHYHPTTVVLANHVMANCPSQGEHSLPVALKINPDKMYEEYSSETMSFNPQVQPPVHPIQGADIKIMGAIGPSA